MFSGYFFLRHSEIDRVIPNSYQLLGTMNNDSQPSILSWEPLVMAPNQIFLVGSHYSWCPRPDKILELPSHFHYVSKKSNWKIKNYPEDLSSEIMRNLQQLQTMPRDGSTDSVNIFFPHLNRWDFRPIWNIKHFTFVVRTE